MSATTMIPATHRRTGRTRRTAVIGLLAVPLLVGVLTACGSANPTSEETSGGKELSLGEWEVSYAACMRDEGIEDFPDPEGGDAGGKSKLLDIDDPEAMDAAMNTCKKKLGDRPAAPGEKQMTDEEVAEQGRKTAQCFRDNGVDMPDPQEGMMAGIPADVPQEVLEKCLGGAVSGKTAG